MDLLKTPSVQSLLDSDLESVESLQYLDIEELDEEEYALPSSEAPTLAEVLSLQEDGDKPQPQKCHEKLSNECSALQADLLQGVSQQLIMAQERSSAGPATALSVGSNGKLTVGTGHGHLLSFHDQSLRWVCDSNADRGAVSCLAYNHDSTRLLAGFGRGIISQYETTRGIILRRITLGGEIWGVLQVTWAGTSGLALDTGGSVWLMKFSRPLGVRSARTSCLFSGARGEVVAMTAKDARILALATLSRVIIVAGGRAAGVRLGGPPDTLPVVEWSTTEDRVLVCGRANILQWLSVNVTGTAISLKPLQRYELKTTPLWLGWLGGSLAIFDSDECLRLWGDDYDKPLDLSCIQPIYASVFYKGLWTDGRVSRAMCVAGSSALGGASVSEGTLSLLGRSGIVRVKPRDLLARAQAFNASGRHLQALRLLCSAHGQEAKLLANEFVLNISEKSCIFGNKDVADQTVKLCLKFNLNEELWGCLWEQGQNEQAFVEAVGEAAVRGEFSTTSPTPDITQCLIVRLAEFDPSLIERVIASLPLTSLDPHQASVFTRERRLWRAVGAIAAALSGSSGAMRELVQYVDSGCDPRVRCECAGGALVVIAADALAGRGAAGQTLPDHARPSARHDALHTLLADDAGSEGRCPLRVMVEHDAASAVRLLEQCARDPPFVGPLGKQNRLRVARSLLSFSNQLQNADDRSEILEFIGGQVSAGALPVDKELTAEVSELAANTEGERADRAWLALLQRGRSDPHRLSAATSAAASRPRVLWRLHAAAASHDLALQEFLRIQNPSAADVEELFEYMRTKCIGSDKRALEPYLTALAEIRPETAAALVVEHFPDAAAPTLRHVRGPRALEFGEKLIEAGRLTGDAAPRHLRNLCEQRPSAVRAFLTKHAGLVRPEDALAIVQECGPPEAEPACLEAVGDPEGALEALLRLVATADEEGRGRLVEAAGELCVRAGPAVPRDTAAKMWRRLLERAGGAPPAVLLEAVSYLPVDVVIGETGDARLARAILECASGRRRAWGCALRVAGREAHESVARAMAAARRGLAVRGDCLRCGGKLHARSAVRTGHCARAYHADCSPAATCDTCGCHLPDVVFSFPRAHKPAEAPVPPPDHDLQLFAPPRPDLEGLV